MNPTKKEDLDNMAKLLSELPKTPELHPSNSDLAAFQSELLEERDEHIIRTHISQCEQCSEKVRWLEDPEVRQDNTKSSWSRLSKVLNRLVEFSLPPRLAHQALAASWHGTEVPDDEQRLDKPGDGPFEAYLQRFGDRLVVNVYCDTDSDVEIKGIRDRDTGELLSVETNKKGDSEWSFDLGTAASLTGRILELSLLSEGRLIRLQAEIAREQSG